MWDGMAWKMKVIWVKRERNIFARGDWTGQISLIPQQNFFSARTRREPIAALNASIRHVTLIRYSNAKQGNAT